MKPFDLSKFRKGPVSKIEGMSTGFHDPKAWVSTNNYTLNYLISGQFDRGIPMGQVTLLGGESGAGKSFISVNIINNALADGHHVIIFDTENAWTKEWMIKAKVDLDKYYGTYLMREQVAYIDDLGQYIAEFMDSFKTTYKDVDQDERPKVLFVLDSASQLLTKTDADQFAKGHVSKGDMGRQAKALKALVKNCTIQFAEWNIGFLVTNHTYASQDMFNPDDVISGGQGFIYASSIVVAMRKLKLKEDEAGNKITDILGIRAAVKVMKTRYSKPFESVQIKIPYESGIDKYSGLVELFEKQGIFEKDGNKLKYIDLQDNEHKYFRKYYATDEGKKILDLAIAEHSVKSAAITKDVDLLEEELDDGEE